MQYGYFDDQQHEYVITRPDTPLPWINYLGSEEYFGLISNTAGGYSFFRDARLRRLTRYRYNNIPFDMGGRYIYLRDDQSGIYWSPSWMPVRRPVSDYTCRHGLGYSTIGSTLDAISAHTTYLVPLDQNLEIWLLHLKNHRDTTARLSVFSTVEFCLWDAWDDSTNFQRNFNTGEVEVEEGVIYHKTEYRERRDHFTYFACSEPLAGFDTQREAFLGPYRGWDAPIAVENGQVSNSITHGWSPVGVHQVRLMLQPGEERQIVYLLGYHENPRQDKFDPPDSLRINKRTVLPVIRQFLNPEQVKTAMVDLNAFWNAKLSILEVFTPDIHTNRMINIWNAYQCMVTFNMSRSASFYESGIGRGMGFRDSNQDLLGFVQMIPERARQRILDLAATQMEGGGAYHQYQPLTKRGNDAVGSNFNDDPAWLVLGVVAYLKETADWGILDEPVPFDNKLGTEAPLYEHLRRSIQYTLDRLGPHGLPLIGRADWNDCLNLNTFSEEPGESFQTTTNRDGKVAESVLIAGLFVLAAGEMAELAHRRDDSAIERLCRDSIEKLIASVDAYGWDGAWFLRAFDHYGNKVGSANCEEGQIFIEPQGICVMAGIGLSDGRATQALDSVRERLATPHGIVLQQPAYSRYYLHLGEISSYPPGYKENAGIFCHTNPWIMIAEAVLGRGDRAHDYYLRINPSAREPLSDQHRCEPYVYAQMIAGRDAPTHGEAKNSWLTGTAAWNYVAITQWILGIRPAYDGLQVQPVLPGTWSGYDAVRYFRGVCYNIHVERDADYTNSHNFGANTVSLEVDGVPIKGTVAPIPPAGTSSVQVVVRLG